MQINLLNLLFVLLAAWLAGSLATRFRYPAVLGELLAGILLGPPMLGLLGGGPALTVLAEVGVLLMMLYIGMEIDPRELIKASWAGVLAAVGGFIAPFVLAYWVVVWFGGSPLAAAFVGIAAGVTSLATKSRILVDLQILDTRVAHVLLAGALVADSLSLVVFAGILGVVEVGTIELGRVALVGLKAVLFFGVTAFVGLKVFPYVGQRLARAGLTGRTFNFTLVLLIAVLFSEAAEVAGLHAILGAFIAGLFIRENVLGRTLSANLIQAVRDASIGFLAPIFFVTVGFAVSLDVFRTDLALFVAILAAATLGKVLGTALFYLPSGYGWREGLAVGAGMNGRGAVEIIIAGIGLERGLISQEIFSILVFMAIFTTASVPAVLKWSTDWLRRRGELVRSREERRGTLIVGAGPVARELARHLREARPVWMIDSNRERCSIAAAESLEIVCGNALQEQMLSEAGAPAADSLVAMTTNAEVNALIARLARDVFLVPSILVLRTESDEEESATLKHLQATALFGGFIPIYEWDYRVVHGEVGIEAVAVEKATTAREFVKALGADDRFPLCVEREHDRLPFHSGLQLVAGDCVRMMSALERPAAGHDRFDRLVAACPVLDLPDAVGIDGLFQRVADSLATPLAMGRDELARALEEREVLGSTVLAPGLAVPHIQLEGAGRFALLLARSRAGVTFPGQTDPVHTIIVLAASRDERNFQLRALSAIAQIVQDPEFGRRWLAAHGTRGLRGVFFRGPRIRHAEPGGVT